MMMLVRKHQKAAKNVVVMKFSHNRILALSDPAPSLAGGGTGGVRFSVVFQEWPLTQK